MHVLQPCLLACAIALSFAPAAHAAKPAALSKQAVALTRNVVAPERGVAKPDGRYRKDGSAISLYQPGFSAPAGAKAGATAAQRQAAAASAAYEYLVARHDVLGLKEDALEGLQQVRVRSFPGFSVVRYRQRQQGLPVYGSDIAVSVQDNGNILYVSNRSVSGLAPVASAKSGGLDASRASAVARAYLGAQAPGHRKAERVVYRDPQGRTLVAWRVEADSWEVLVDERSGEVVRAEDTMLYANASPTVASGWVFQPDPLSSARKAYDDPGYTDGDNANTPELTSQLRTVLLRDISYLPGGRTFRLTGPYADCRDIEEPNDNACPNQKQRNFQYARDHVHFDAVNAYFHIDSYMRYVNDTLKIAVVPYQYKGGVRFDPHGFGGGDNSRYSRLAGDLSFGEGGVDDAQDADVVVHELGHGLHDWLTDGNLSQVEGLSEGVGDYLAAGYSRDLAGQWQPGDAAYDWVFNWDGHNPFWDGRVTNWNLTHIYPDIGFGHTAGQYWSSCNLVARKAVGARDMDTAFLAGLTMTGGDTNQKDAAQAVINAAAALGLSRAKVKAIGNAYNVSCDYEVTVPAV
ncbi:hypothetical protein [Luteimonas aquatica]|uniref:hypothetical protein n=1 Tax=Luteimonas aquatica TaxID=450364 RepID=UPI001F56E119|nr:hypothetical protein [Luteimonas aquatica]